MVKRIVNPSKSNSFFLFGARGTGKSTFIKNQFLKDVTGVMELDLLDPNLEDMYSRRPMHLYEEIRAQTIKPDWIFIDEVQKIPKLLDVVHKSIEDLKVKFILTGSSARKLKRGGANLLAGRAFLYSLFPFTEKELADQFNLNEVLQRGSLPQLYSLKNDEDKERYLKAFTLVYLKEEIRTEQIIRNIDPFREFLEIAAQMSGKIINIIKLATKWVLIIRLCKIITRFCLILG